MIQDQGVLRTRQAGIPVTRNVTTIFFYRRIPWRIPFFSCGMCSGPTIPRPQRTCLSRCSSFSAKHPSHWSLWLNNAFNSY